MVAFAENTYTAACAGDETRVGMKTHTRANRGVQNVWGLDLSGSLSGAGGVGGLLSVVRDTNAYFTAYDGNGNVSEYVDATGDIAAHYEYSPFGETIVATGPNAKDFAHRFSTKPAEDNTGLVLYEHRPYSPSIGRWLSKDPSKSTKEPLYVSVKNNPINAVDFRGLFTWPELKVEEVDRPPYSPDNPGGLSWIETWKSGVRVDATDRWWRRKVVVDGEGKAQWWTTGNVYTASEMEHIKVWKTWWGDLGNVISPLTGTYCYHKALCHKDCIAILTSAYRDGSDAENAGIDCRGHQGDPTGGNSAACVVAALLWARYDLRMLAYEAQKTACDLLP